MNRSHVWVAVLSIVLVGLFFFDFLAHDRLPVTSGDPAIVYHNHVEAAKWLERGEFPLWRQNVTLGSSLFQVDISLTPFHMSSVLFWLISDERLAHVLFVAFQAFLIIGGTFFYLSRNLRIPPFIALTGGALFLFTPGFLNEYLFNSFGGIALLPIMLHLVGRFHVKKSFLYVNILIALLWICYFISNIAMVQFALIYLALYSFYLLFSPSRNSLWLPFWRTVIFYGLSVAGFLGVSAYYILPFLREIIFGDRAHLYRLFDSIPLRAWVLSLHLPFTSWIFVDEKMLTTGLLTYLESLNIYTNVLLLPCLLLYFLNPRAFQRSERFFFVYTAGFMFLSVVNQYVPILSLLVKYTKGTGWHRSLPLYFFSASMCISIMAAKLHAGEWRPAEGRWNALAFQGYRFHRLALVGMYALAAAGVAFTAVAYIGFEWKGISRALSLLSVRKESQFIYYLAHYFSFPRIIYIFLVPSGIFVSLWTLESLRRSKVGSTLSGWACACLLISLVVSQFALSRLYYPFNRGVDKVRAMKEVTFIKDLSHMDRLAIIFNKIGDVEKYVIKKHDLPDDIYNPELHLISREYPEQARFQSNITMQGSFFGRFDVGVYTRGVNLVDKRVARFHMAVLRDNAYLTGIFEKKKGYLRLGPKDVRSPLLDIAGVNYFLSSLPLESDKLDFVFQGDSYFIYRNKRAVPRFLLVNKVQQVNNESEALQAIQSSEFDPRETAIVETPIRLSSVRESQRKSFVELVSFRPNVVELNVLSSSGGFLVFNDAYHPGWRAWVDGRESHIHRANYVFKGIVVPGGSHRVTFRFSPPWFREGLAVTATTVLLILGLWIFGTVRRKRSRA